MKTEINFSMIDAKEGDIIEVYGAPNTKLNCSVVFISIYLILDNGGR